MLSEQFPHHISEPILIVVEVCDNIGVGFHFVRGIFHGDTAACGFQHGDVVFRIPGGKKLSLQEILESCEVDEPFEGADKIFFQPAAGHCLLLTNESDCTLMQNREILMKGHSYEISLNSKVDITFEDERSEIALQYRDVKPSDMRLLAAEPQ